MRAVDRFLLCCGALILIAPLPLEIHWLGWRGASEAALSCALGLLAYDWFFSSWNKLPFTCSHLPGKTPGWIMALQFFAVITLVPVLNAVLLAVLYKVPALVVALAALAAAWTRVHALRQEGWSDLRLKYEELPDPAVHGLNLMR